MSDIAIRVENLGKRYRIGQREPYKTLRDTVTEAFTAPFRWWGKHNSSASQSSFGIPKSDYIWALRDVSFEVKPGEVVGIIGRNGAGKSTLLKVLSRTTEPTEGYAEIYGRIGSLLEVGTGFHPELSGRENIYLNAAILGMKRREIVQKFDEIVDFAEVEKFLDTPVKHYSSGMYVRLAFAVAAHLEPEILLVDEVLAVGDAAFQKKCLGKMGEVAQGGRTVLFVSHNMNAVEELCQSCILLSTGKIDLFGHSVREAINLYFSTIMNTQSTSEWIFNGSELYRNPYFSPSSFRITGRDGQVATESLRCDDEIWVQIEGNIEIIDPALTLGYAICAEDGRTIYWSYYTDSPEDKWPSFSRGKVRLRSKIPPHLLNEGRYRIELIGSLFNRCWLFEPGRNAPQCTLSVRGGLSDSPYWREARAGYIAPLMEWESESIS